MSPDLSKVLKEVIPRYGTRIENYEEIRNKYHKVHSRLDQKSKTSTYSSNNIPIDQVGSEIQRKHHEIMEKIRAKGRLNHGTYKLSGDDKEEVMKDLKDLIEDVDEEISKIERQKIGFLLLLIVLIALPLIASL